VVDGRADRVHDDDYGGNGQYGQHAQACDVEPGREPEHVGDEVALVVRGVGAVHTAPLPRQGIDPFDVIQTGDFDLDFGRERVPLDLLYELLVAGIRRKTLQLLVLGDEAHTDHFGARLQLAFEVVNGRQRRLVGNADGEHTHPMPVRIQHLTECVAEQEAGAGKHQDQRNRHDGGNAHGEVAPEVLPGATEGEEQLPEEL